MRRIWSSMVGAGAVVASLVLPAGAAGPAAGAADAAGMGHAVCGAVGAGVARCHARLFTGHGATPLATTAPTGLAPITVKSAYGFSTDPTAGSGKTIAIVDAYDDPGAESDLGVFDTTFGLPACTTSNGCFSKVNQNGGKRLPSASSSWAVEISLDVQWAHAIAPGAHILLVEASSSSLGNLLTAESYAKSHAQYVSNSWGTSEFLGETSYDSYFVQSGTSVFVASGDNGTPAEWPSSNPGVISVGGTTLNLDTNNQLVSETGWSGSGGGCSVYEVADPNQATAPVDCGGTRATPDVALDADPSTGVPVYDSTPYNGQSGWWKVGGTSASAPMWAGRSADQGVVVNAAYVYGANIKFYDVTSGNNGASAGIGYDLVTGRGSWSDANGSTSGSSGGGSTAGTLAGTVTDTGGSPIYPATVSLSNTAYSATTNSSGQYSMTVPAGTYTATASATGYTSATTSVTVYSGQTTPSDFQLSPSTTSQLTVGVTSITYAQSGHTIYVSMTVQEGTLGLPVAGATVLATAYYNGSPIGSVTVTSNGSGVATYSIRGAKSGTYHTHIDNVVATGFTWDTLTPANTYTMP